MPEQIRHWTLGSDAKGNVQLNIHIDGKHYTLDVHEKDVQSMQNTLDVKAILAQAATPKDAKNVRVVSPISDGNRILAKAGEVLTAFRDTNRIGCPQAYFDNNNLRICDVDSHTAKTQCIPID